MTFNISRTKPALLVSFTILLSLIFVFSENLTYAQTTPTPARETTTPSKYTDTPDDIIKNLANEGYYVSQEAKDIINDATIETKLAEVVKKLKDKKHDTRIAIVSEPLLNDASTRASLNNKDDITYPYGEYLRKNLKPAPESVIILMVATDKGNDLMALAEDKLEASENSQLLKNGFDEIHKQGYAGGIVWLAEKTADKIGGKGVQKAADITGIIIVVVIVVVAIIVLLFVAPIILEILGALIS